MSAHRWERRDSLSLCPKPRLSRPKLSLFAPLSIPTALFCSPDLLFLEMSSPLDRRGNQGVEWSFSTV